VGCGSLSCPQAASNNPPASNKIVRLITTPRKIMLRPHGHRHNTQSCLPAPGSV